MGINRNGDNVIMAGDLDKVEVWLLNEVSSKLDLRTNLSKTKVMAHRDEDTYIKFRN